MYLVGTVYNFCTPHESLYVAGGQQTPAMAAGLTDRPMLMAELVQILDAREQNAIYDRRAGLLSQAN